MRALASKIGPLLSLVVLGVAVAAIVYARGIVPLQAGAAGCSEVAAGSVVESGVYTPYDQQRSHLPDQRLNPEGQPLQPGVDGVPTSIDGLSLQWLMASGSGSYAYFAAAPVDAATTAASFVRDGGIQLDVEPLDGSGSFAEWLLGHQGKRAVKVTVGEFVGAVTWSDPDSYGSRPHNVFWSDGSANYTLTGIASAEHLVTLARQMQCA